MTQSPLSPKDSNLYSKSDSDNDPNTLGNMVIPILIPIHFDSYREPNAPLKDLCKVSSKAFLRKPS